MPGPAPVLPLSPGPAPNQPKLQQRPTPLAPVYFPGFRTPHPQSSCAAIFSLPFLKLFLAIHFGPIFSLTVSLTHEKKTVIIKCLCPVENNVFPSLCVECKLPLQCLGCKNVCLCVRVSVRKEFTWCQHEKKGPPSRQPKSCRGTCLGS